MKVFVDSNPIDTNDRKISTITGLMPTKQRPLLIERKVTKSIVLKNRYNIETNKGNFTIETFNNRFHDFFKENMMLLKNIKVQWTDKNSVNFGLFSTQFEVTKKQFDYENHTVLLGLSGFDREQGILIFSKKGHITRNGIENSVFGKIIKGKHILGMLKANDILIAINKVEVKSELYEYDIITSDSILKEGDNIITKMIVELDEDCPFASEHFLFMTMDNEFKIDRKTKTFCRNDSLRGVKLPMEKTKMREKGSISIRNTGKGKGSVFIYLLDTIDDSAHSVIGRVTNGIELPSNLGEGAVIRVESKTTRLNTLGLSQSNASILAGKHGLEHLRTGNTQDDAIVIEQDPELSIDARKKGSIITKGVDPSIVFKVRFYENKAPESVKYFKTITGLSTRQLGKLDVLLAHKEVDMIMFKGDSKLAGELSPENPPLKGSKKGKIGITNMASRQMGTIGVRFNDSDEYGPTGEDAYHTNCVGEILNLDELRKVKEGETIYLIME